MAGQPCRYPPINIGAHEPTFSGRLALLSQRPREKEVSMTIIKINAITVPADGGADLARRFAARAGAVDNQPGFEGFELLEPTDERTTWLVITRWSDDESFQAWVSSAAFGQGHRGAEAEGADKPAPARPAMTSELWSFEIAGGSSR